MDDAPPLRHPARTSWPGARGSVCLLACALTWALSTVAFAQAHPDIVELVDGSFYRGTIVERVRGDHVVIQTASGQLLRFEEAQIAHAGAARQTPRLGLGDPSAVPPSYATPASARAPASDGSVRVRVAPTGGGPFTLHQLRATASAQIPGSFATVTADAFGPLCNAPCELQLQPGAYWFGVSQGSGRALRADGPPTTVAGESLDLEIHYEDRGAVRAMGWVSWVVGLLGVGGIGTLGVFTDSFFSAPILGPVISLAVVSTIVWAVLAYWGDSAIVRRVSR